MTISQTLWHLLIDNSPLPVPAVGTRFSLLVAPQGQAKPYGVLSEVSQLASIENELQDVEARIEPASFRKWRFSLDIYSEDYTEAELARKQAVTWLLAAATGVGGINGILSLSMYPGFTETERLYKLCADLLVIESLVD